MKILFLLPIVLIIAFTGCSANETVAAFVANDNVMVNTITPTRGNITVVGEYIGVIQPIQQVAVLPRLMGEVTGVYANVGDFVEEGDILFTIDTTELEINIAALEAQLDVQDATVRAAQTGVRLIDGSAMQSQVIQAQGGVAQAEAAVQQATLNVEQALLGIEQAQLGYDMAAQGLSDTTILFEAGIVTRNVFEQAEAGYANAAAGLERAQSSYALANIGLSQAELGHSQALEAQRILLEQAPEENRTRAQDGLAQAQAARNIIVVNLEAVQDRLNDATVRAPISGIIEMRNVEQFGFASPQAPAFLISEQNVMTVTFRVPRISAMYFNIGDALIVSDGGEEFGGAISEMSTMVDHGGLVTVTADIPNPPSSLLSGTNVRVFVDAQRADDTLIVPLGAIHHIAGVPHVYVADMGVARLTAVQTGIFNADYIQILSGVGADARIINTWSARLTDGVAIEVLRGE
ncbi:MAG: efflux RND transporter periplasmic adaptor subunit [Defluviitaleaceae bacterium]|nr:efflux RND transporter periplasmic adaptor subunit [Defluviitaleaceae bacterium]